jgi:choline dehydrogenase-like flavoprotein
VDWPIRYEDLADYYCQSEQLLSVKGSVLEQAGAEPPRSCDFPIELEENHGDPGLTIDDRRLEFFLRPRSMRGKQPVRLADVEVPRFSKTRLGTLLDDQRVTEIVTLDGKSVSHVSTRSRYGDKAEVFAKNFVIAAGAIESPRLLLASRSHWFPTGMGNTHDLVGRYFCYHPHIHGTCTPTGRHAALAGSDLRIRSHSLDDTLHSHGMNAFNIQLNYNSRDTSVDVSLSPDTEPRAENRLTLVSDRVDSLGLPIPDLHVSHSRRDQETFRYADSVGDQINSALGGKQPLDYERRIHSHPSGTCRMSADASSGVVDANNRVFGVENLYVSGACVFPLAGATNPTNTVVAMTLRLADHLIEQHHA